MSTKLDQTSTDEMDLILLQPTGSDNLIFALVNLNDKQA